MFQRFCIGGGLLIGGLIILSQSANMSFQGYDKEFETLFGAGFIGIGFAVLGFFATGAIPVAQRIGSGQILALALAMSVLFSAADIYGNWLATGGDVEAEQQEAKDNLAEWESAQAELPQVRKELTDRRSELATVAGEDIRAAQRFLKAKGLYLGKIDGVYSIRGRISKTEQAINDYAVKANQKIETLEGTEALLVSLLKTAKPEVPSDSEAIQALLIAIGLTLSSMLASLLGGWILAGGTAEDELSALEEEVDGIEAEVFDLAAYLKEREAS